ncbi:hypothetical protein GH714_039652 [Hevea brasiliensis]|uniref:GPI inositol-deacylase PGAP1-like alpha/beta domain-containing protein n=1 Tax=Hevea brasiliensis TaxID=3981 RepID=A0A6A6KEN1_HEVBR|nr:hypothetical protein GH714_039652 [Hevea brasiliensis]
MDGRILEEHTEYVVYAIHKILDQYRESRDAREREGAVISGSLPKSVILTHTLSRSPPVALQPSLGHYFKRVNQEWRKRYEVQTTRTGRYVSDPLLSHVVVVSISGGYNDYQVRSKLESLEDIVPSTHGFMISSTGMRNVWFSSIPSSHCPSNVHWNDDGLEKDLYIQTTTMTVLAMDGRRRWLDIQKLGSNGKSHFIFVTNLAPCFGVRLHLWPEKAKLTSDLAASKRVVEVTSKLVKIPSRPAPRQMEPGSQTEQAPPSAVLCLSPEEMQGFRFLTISVAPRPEIFLKEDHPLAFNLSFSISLGLLPVTLSLKTMGCGIKRSGLLAEEAGYMENSRLCKLRCFPPVALAWDPTSGIHMFPNLHGETIIVDSSPALWSSTQGSERTTVLLLVDPHCSYKMSIAVSETAAASRFLLLYSSQFLLVTFAIFFVFSLN